MRKNKKDRDLGGGKGRNGLADAALEELKLVIPRTFTLCVKVRRASFVDVHRGVDELQRSAGSVGKGIERRGGG